MGGWTEYQGAQGVVERARRWYEDTAFQVGAFVVASDELRYEATAVSTNQEPPNALFWIQRTFVIPFEWQEGNFFNVNALTKKFKIGDITWPSKKEN